MSNTITIELCAEDRLRLDNILTALAASRPNCERCASYVAELFTGIEEAPERPCEQAEAPTEEEPIIKEETAPATAEKVSREDVQTLVVQLSAVNLKAQVRAIVLDYADRVSGIPEEKLPEVMDRLKRLEAAEG